MFPNRLRIHSSISLFWGSTQSHWGGWTFLQKHFWLLFFVALQGLRPLTLRGPMGLQRNELPSVESTTMEKGKGKGWANPEGVGKFCSVRIFFCVRKFGCVPARSDVYQHVQKGPNIFRCSPSAFSDVPQHGRMFLTCSHVPKHIIMLLTFPDVSQRAQH